MTESIKIVCILAATAILIVLNMGWELTKSQEVRFKIYCHENQMRYDKATEDCAAVK